MNPLEKQVTKFVLDAHGVRQVTVLDKEFCELFGEPDYLSAELSNGHNLAVMWDSEKGFHRFRIDGKEVEKEQTLLSIFALDALCDEVYQKYHEDKIEWVEEAP